MRDKILSWLIPDYFEKMPEDKVGYSFTAHVVILAPEFGTQCRIYTYDSWNSRRDAYRQARWKAWLHDCFNIRYHGGYGIQWQITSPKEK